MTRDTLLGDDACNRTTRESPVVEVSEEHMSKFSLVQIGQRVLAALAHTPVQGHGNYHAIVVAKDRETVDKTTDDVLDEGYDTIIQHKISINDEYRAEIGQLVVDRLDEADTFILGRS